MNDIKELIKKINDLEKKKVEYEYELNRLTVKKSEIEKKLQELGISPINIKDELIKLEIDITKELNELEDILNDSTIQG